MTEKVVAMCFCEEQNARTVLSALNTCQVKSRACDGHICCDAYTIQLGTVSIPAELISWEFVGRFTS